MTATNDTTGDRLVTRTSQVYKDKFENVFGNIEKCVHRSESGLYFKQDRSDINSISAKCRKPEECNVREVGE